MPLYFALSGRAFQKSSCPYPFGTLDQGLVHISCARVHPFILLSSIALWGYTRALQKKNFVENKRQDNLYAKIFEIHACKDPQKVHGNLRMKKTIQGFQLLF